MARAEMTVHLKDFAEFKELVARLERALTLCQSVRYKVPGYSETYGSYAEGRHDLAGEIETILDGTGATDA